MFDENFLNQLPSEPILAINEVVDKTLELWANIHEDQILGEYESFLEAFAIVNTLSSHINDIFIVTPKIEGSPHQAVNQIIDFFRELKNNVSKHLVSVRLAQFNGKYEARYGKVFTYEFSEGDLKKIQKLINELRDIISASELFEQTHKMRILARLEKIQTELHKKMTDLDRL